MAYYVSSGVTSTGIVLKYDVMTVLGGGTANETAVNSYGYLYVSSGGTALNVVWTPCVGRVDAADGAIVTYASQYSGVYFGSDNRLLSSAMTMTGKNVDGSMYVMSGGTANSTTVNSGGLHVLSGGTANETIVNASGYMVVSSDGTANESIVNSGGALTVSSGGTANSTTVNSGGYLTVSSGGSALNIVWTPCVGRVDAADGAIVTYASQHSGVYFGSNDTLLSSAMTFTEMRVDSYTSMVVMSGGTANSTTVNSSGGLYVSSGGTANSTTVNFYGYLGVSSGGIANSTTVISVGCMRIHNGGTANETTVTDWGDLYVYSGGIANSTTVNSGGRLWVSSGGIANSTTVNSSGYLVVSSGGTATNITAADGARLYLTVAPDTYIHGTSAGSAFEMKDAAISGYTVNSDWYLYVSSGGTANSTTVNSSGWLIVSSGGTANSTTVNFYGYLVVSSGGTANQTTVSGWAANLYVYDGGTANSTTVNYGGRLSVGSGGTANSTTINSSGHLYISSGGTASSATVNSYGYLTVSSGGTALQVTENGGRLRVYSGGTALQITENGGYVGVEDGANVTFVANTFSGLVLSSYQSATVHSGTTANTTTVNGGGELYVYSGGAANVATINSRGSMIVSSGGTALAVTENGGYVWVDDDAIVTFAPNSFSGEILSSGQYATVHSGTTANQTTVTFGSMRIYNGGTASSTTVYNGRLYILSGGTVCGLRIATDAIVSAYAGAVVSFDLTERTTADAALVNNLAFVQGTPDYTITVSATQAEGTYRLADGAARFAQTVTISVTGGESGSLSVGSTVKLSGQDYTLNLDAGSLTLTAVRDTTPPAKPTAAADITTATNKDVTVTATFSDDSVQKQYSKDGGEWTAYTAGIVFTANGTVSFRGIDAAGNVSEVTSYPVTNIDKIAPEAPVAAADVTAPTNQDVTVAATFSGDSVQKQYSKDGGEWTAYTTGIVFTANGTVSFRGIDAMGNVSDVTSYPVTNIDKIAPEAPVAAADVTAPTNQDVTVTATFSDDSVQKQYSKDGGEWTAYTAGIVFTANGTVSFRGIDAAGNVSEVTSYPVTNIDKIAPETPTAVANTTAPTNQDVTVAATFCDDSAIREYSLDGEVWTAYTSDVIMPANGTVYFRGMDAAGNISEVTSYEVNNIANAPAGLFLGDASSAALVSDANAMFGTILPDTGNLLMIYSGGTANSTTVSSGGSLTVFSCGTAYSTTIDKDGVMCVSSGGTASSVIWQSGGRLVVGPSAVISIATIRDDNTLPVSKGTVVDSITVSSAGKVAVSAGGRADFVNIASSGTLEIHSGGTANRVYVSRYGSFTAESGTVISGLHVLSRGGIYEVVVPDESGEGKIVSSAGVVVSGNQLYDAHLYSSARLSCLDGAVLSGGQVGSDAQLYLGSGAEGSALSVARMGTLYVDNGGIAHDTQLTPDGKMIILGETRGISAAGASICLGDSSFAEYDEAGWPTSNAYEEDIHAFGTTLDSSWMLVYYGASATETEVTSNSWLHVYWGGSAVKTEITSSGYLTVHQSGTADTVDLHSGGYMRLYTGAIVKGDINVGGKVTVQQAGTSATEDVIRAYGARVNFALNERKSSDEAIITDLGMIMGATYFVTVSGDQASGTYRLATGATDFDASVTVKTGGGTTLGTISIGQNLSYGGFTCSLVKNEDLLSLTVSGAPGIEEKFTPGDLNADGRADIVMTIAQEGHAADGATGAWLIQSDQTAAWGDLSQRNPGWEIFGTGWTAVDKATADVYVKSTGNVIGAWATADDGRVNGWATIGEFDDDTQVVGLGDFNGNGQTDLLLRNANGAVGCFFTGGETTGWNYFQSLGDEWKLAAIGDLNGDGRDDVVLKHDAGFAGSWLTQADGTMAWADLDTLPDGFAIVGSGDFNGDGTDDVLLQKDSYFGAWLVQNGNAAGWFGLGDLGNVTVEQIADFDGDGRDDLRIRTAAGDLGAQLVKGADTLEWRYYGSVGEEWSTSLAAL